MKKYLGIFCCTHYRIYFSDSRKVQQESTQRTTPLEYIPDDYKTQEMCKKAVEADPCLLKFVPVHLRTHCFKVVKKRKAQKAKIKEELMRVAWHPSR